MFRVGMGSLTVAGGGAYYFAKKSINADRAARFEESEKRRRQVQASLEYSSTAPSKTSSSSAMGGSAAKSTNDGPAVSSGSPSQEATLDPAPTRHAPETEGQRVMEKSKYETATPFKATKGDRFS
ncbi:hypothetical protein LOCC1_G006526 [Lachnellula occidentalis]|uniref:Uncharacterized protein n=1 Tax=Lachnellula occidentalis TaxID=215460 RepID=A0A8H8RQN2_9HELO|nr:hypothetical protein LOCC1_G006526 [Lachnellula occidentalis]